ncbi:nucleotidyltransferase [Variovorax sp. LjRoot175]|uniref:CBASS oligonucleotide cyclase n=1 Tax=Variovorax sp. LjRoot175 TaxID=3342276 RepID=UPI003ECDD848
MGGSSGSFGRAGSGRTPSDFAEQLRKDAETSALQFETELSEEFADLLSRFNARNSDQTNERLEAIKDVLHDNIDADSSFDTMFGGSVAKHTYVDGLSDVDAMLVVEGDLTDASPRAVLEKVANALEDKLESEAKISRGTVAITVSYKDGTEIQLVPSIRDGEKLRVPAWEADKWSSIDPKQFRDGLTKRNNECAGKLIPTLKLAKAINAVLPESARLSGYHIEALGVAAFRDYKEERTTVRMLPYFFKRASELVLNPVADRTGQSVHVDQYLGPAMSSARVGMSHLLLRMHQRMMNASAAKSRDRWRDLFDE